MLEVCEVVWCHAQVVITDGIDEVVDLLKANVAKYGGSVAESVTVHKLEWGEKPSHDALLAAYPAKFPVIIGADVVFAFFPNSISLLFKAVQVRGLCAPA